MQKNEITEKEIKATPPKIQEDINLAAPGKLRVIKRNGKVVAFENEKIQVAVTKASLPMRVAMLPQVREYMRKLK